MPTTPRPMQKYPLSVTHTLIALCVAVFILGLFWQQQAVLCIPYPTTSRDLLCPVPEIYGAFSDFTAVRMGEWWRFITYQFLHADLGHILFNMVALGFFGPPIERIFGAKRFLLYYFTCGIGGALCASALAEMNLYTTLAPEQLCNMLAQMAGYEYPVAPWQMVPLVGASASIYGLMVAAAFIFPDARIQLLFPPIIMRLRTFSLCVIAFAAFTILFGLSNAGGEAGHLGGIIMGTVLMVLRSILKRTPAA